MADPGRNRPARDAKDSVSSSDKKSLGETLEETLKKSALLTIISVYVLGFGSAIGIWKFVDSDLPQKVHNAITRISEPSTADVRNRPSVSTLLEHPKGITVIGPVTGEEKELGLRQLRGVIGGIIHFLTVEEHRSRISPSDWNRYFKIRVLDTGGFSADAEEHKKQIRQSFVDAQAAADVIFGPAHSQEVVDALDGTALKKLTILTSAGTTAVREHPQYGSLIWQLSNDANGYAQQYVHYIQVGLRPPPAKTFIFYREAEYGKNSSAALVSAFQSGGNLNVVQYPYDDISTTPMPAYIDGVEQTLQAHFKEINSLGRQAMVLIADQGPTLDALVPRIRKACPAAVYGTLTTLTHSEIADGNFESAYLIYSYAPLLFSGTQIKFLASETTAQHFMMRDVNLLPKKLSAKEWGNIPINSDDAEVHDATIYYLRKTLSQYNEFADEPSGHLYATDFAISGSGRDLRNVGDLFVLQVKSNQLSPVPPPDYENDVASVKRQVFDHSSPVLLSKYTWNQPLTAVDFK